MNWRDKMKETAESILNQDRPTPIYKFTLLNDTKYKLEKRESGRFIEICVIETIENLAAHWKRHVKELVLHLTNQIINSVLATS